jgi:hypothetical protein
VDQHICPHVQLFPNHVLKFAYFDQILPKGMCMCLHFPKFSICIHLSKFTHITLLHLFNTYWLVQICLHCYQVPHIKLNWRQIYLHFPKNLSTSIHIFDIYLPNIVPMSEFPKLPKCPIFDHVFPKFPTFTKTFHSIDPNSSHLSTEVFAQIYPNFPTFILTLMIFSKIYPHANFTNICQHSPIMPNCSQLPNF